MTRFMPNLTLCAFAGAASAISGVTNPAEMGRMEAISTIAAEVKALSRMGRGEAGFDAAAVAERMQAIAAARVRVPVLSEAPERDPESEAAPTIWTSYPEFTRRAAAMTEAAEAGAGVTDMAAMQQALGALAETCKSCHASFKLP